MKWICLYAAVLITSVAATKAANHGWYAMWSFLGYTLLILGPGFLGYWLMEIVFWYKTRPIREKAWELAHLFHGMGFRINAAVMVGLARRDLKRTKKVIYEQDEQAISELLVHLN